MRRRASTSNGKFPDGYIQPSRTGFLVYFFEAYILLFSDLSETIYST